MNQRSYMKALWVVLCTTLWTVTTGGCAGVEQGGESQPDEDLAETSQAIEARGRPTRISAGANHTLSVRQDGTVWASGYGASGQIGNSSSLTQLSPVQVGTGVPSFVNLVSVGAGGSHSLALQSNGNAWAWGLNGDGQLGTNTTNTEYVPKPVTMPVGIRFIGVSAGLKHSVAVADDGSVYTWGDVSYKQLGLGAAVTFDQKTPQKVTGVSNVVAVSAGKYHTLALTGNGSVYVWGDNTFGQLGDGAVGSTVGRSTPYKVNLSGVVGISAGQYHSMAVTMDGSVYAWGDNTYGQVGSGTVSATPKATPYKMTTISNAVAVAAGNYHSIALKSDGSVVTWGHNAYGQLGNNSFASPLPTLQTLSGAYTDVIGIAAGAWHSVILRAGGQIMGFGYNFEGEIGDNTSVNKQVPTNTNALSGLAAVAAGDNHTVALRWDGTVYAWGLNSSGQLGDNSPIKRPTPVQSGYNILSGVVAVAAGANHSLALKSNGTVWAWGKNDKGQLGINSTTNSLVPVQVSLLTGIVAIAAGTSHSVALKSDGTVYAWGYNLYGQLGDSSNTDRLVPVAATGFSSTTRAVAIAAGGTHTIAVIADGTAYGWGRNDKGQICDDPGAIPDSNVQNPIFMLNVPATKAIVGAAAGTSHSLFLLSTGEVWSCGLNANGQLGNNSQTDSYTPVQVVGIAGFSTTRAVAIAAGSSHSVILTADGSLWSTGANGYGQIGDGTMLDTLGLIEPVLSGSAALGQVTDISTKGAVAIAAGQFHTVVARPDGSVATWGKGGQGQLGNGSNLSTSYAVLAVMP